MWPQRLCLVLWGDLNGKEIKKEEINIYYGRPISQIHFAVQQKPTHNTLKQLSPIRIFTEEIKSKDRVRNCGVQGCQIKRRWAKEGFTGTAFEEGLKGVGAEASGHVKLRLQTEWTGLGRKGKWRRSWLQWTLSPCKSLKARTHGAASPAASQSVWCSS